MRPIPALFLAIPIFLFPCPSRVHAESPPEHAWQAQWIGSATPPIADMIGAAWIWSDAPGLNTITIQGQNDPDEGPLNAAGIIAKIVIEQKGGSVQEIVTDAQWQSAESAVATTWKALRHPAFGRTGEPHPNYRMPDENVHFDARLDIGDWTAPGFDDASWKSADAFGTPPAAPWNRLIERPTLLWRTGGLTAYETPPISPRSAMGSQSSPASLSI